MLYENTLFSIFKNKKLVSIFCLSNMFSWFFVIENKKLFQSRTENYSKKHLPYKTLISIWFCFKSSLFSFERVVIQTLTSFHLKYFSTIIPNFNL